MTGKNSFALSAAAADILAAFTAEHGEFDVERLDAEASLERLQQALTGVPFLSARKLVVINGGAANKAFAEAAPDLLSDIGDTTDVLLIEPKLDKRSGYYKYLHKNTDYKEFTELDAAGLARWLANRAKEQGGTLKPADAQYLVTRVGTNQQLLANELDKLLLYNPQIDRPAIDALTDETPQSTIFELLDAAFAGQTDRALKLYAEQRALKVEPQQIIAMLAWQWHILALIKTAGDRTPDQIAGEAKVSPYTVKKSQRLAARLSLSDVKRHVAELQRLDVLSKTDTLNVNEAVQYYLVSLAK